MIRRLVGERLRFAASGRSPYHRALQSRLVALSRCPDASNILAAWVPRSMARMGKSRE
jgi:hypothetical protein